MKISKLVFKVLLGSSILWAGACKKEDDSTVKNASLQIDAIRQVAVLTINFPALATAVAIERFVIQKPIDPNDLRYTSLTNRQFALKKEAIPDCQDPPSGCAVVVEGAAGELMANNVAKPGSTSIKVDIPLNKLPQEIQDQLAKSPIEPEGDNDPTGGGIAPPALDILLTGQAVSVGLALDGPVVGTPISIQATAPALMKK